MGYELKPYPAYKYSGIPWLGQVPEHWEVNRLRNVAEMRVSNVDKHIKEDEEPVRLCNYVDVYKNDQIRAGMPFMRATAGRDEVDRFRLAVGDVLITKDSEAWDDIGVPALVIESADDLICGYHLALLRPFTHRIFGEYLFRALQSSGVTYQFHVEANGVTRYGLSHSAIKSIVIPTPPLPEQTAIARYLDIQDRLFNRYIRLKRRQIELLNEQKQAIIQQAVTRGLDPNVRLKPSGVEWLGDVPEHWEVKPIKREFDCLNHKRVPLSGVQREAMTIRRYDYYGASGIIDKVDDYIFEEDLILIAEDGANLVLRNLQLVIIARGKYWVNNHAHILRPRNGNLQYFAYLLELLDFRPWITGAAQPKLTKERLLNVYIPLPSREEQDKLEAHVQTETSELTWTIERIKHEIELNREYRTRLISDVVTGKLDVRGVDLSASAGPESLDLMEEEAENLAEGDRELPEEIEDADD